MWIPKFLRRKPKKIYAPDPFSWTRADVNKILSEMTFPTLVAMAESPAHRVPHESPRNWLLRAELRRGAIARLKKTQSNQK